jgi:hypothetical protein
MSSLDTRFRPLLACAWLVVTACSDDANAGPASCDAAAERLIERCDPLTGEAFRAQCEIDDGLFSPQHLRCLANLASCDEAQLDACGYRSLAAPSCDATRTCDAPWICDTELEECVRCLGDDDCAPGRGCLLGLCFDVDSAFYATLVAAGSADAGAP